VALPSAFSDVFYAGPDDDGGTVCWQSTGSFFPDRSTTLGTLMGVSAFGGQRRALGAAPAAAREEERDRAQRAAREDEEGAGRRSGVWRRQRLRRQRRRSLGGSWWRLCRDDDDGAPTSLGEFLDMERQLAGAEFLCGDGAGGSGRDPVAAALFEADGRVRPPQQQPAASEEKGRWRLLRAPERSSSLARLPVLLTGIICSGGAG
jgi:hypothetical protein